MPLVATARPLIQAPLAPLARHGRSERLRPRHIPELGRNLVEEALVRGLVVLKPKWAGEGGIFVDGIGGRGREVRVGALGGRTRDGEAGRQGRAFRFVDRWRSKGTGGVAGGAVETGGREAGEGGVAGVFEVGVDGFAEQGRAELDDAWGSAGEG